MCPALRPVGLLAASLVPSAALGEPLSPVLSDAAVGLDVAGVHQSVELNGVESTAGGTAAGIHAYLQGGPWIRLEGRVLGASLDHDAANRDVTETAALADLRATVGMAVDERTRVYFGLGAEALSGDSPFGDGSIDSWSVHLPTGIARAADWLPGWRALVTLEGRFVLNGAEEIDNVPDFGNVEFERTGGWGLAFSARFRPVDGNLEIEPYISYTAPSDTDAVTIAGQSVRVEEISRGTAGIRLTAVF